MPGGDIAMLQFRHRSLAFLLAGGVGLLLTHFALAGDDHNAARQALRNGQVRQLVEILEQLRTELNGEVIEVQFKARKKGVPFIYEFKVLNPNGRVSEVTVDAATAKIIGREDD
jgi:uncharacterized membrane protein YkoI